MIRIDRTSSTRISEQLSSQLRYHIAIGTYRVGDRLPSTRKMAEHAGISFHTVRKAYGELEKDGLLSATKGSGFEVILQPVLDKADRSERGAEIIDSALKEMKSLGLADAEIEYLFQEQLAYFNDQTPDLKLVFAAPFRELASWGADHLESRLHLTVESVLLNEIDRHPDADNVVVPIANLQEALHRAGEADVIGVHVHPDPGVLESVARLLPSETIGLVTRYPDAIGPTMSEIKLLTGFTGQIVAAPVGGRSRDRDAEIRALLDRCDLLIYTDASKRIAKPHIEQSRRSLLYHYIISDQSLEDVMRRISR